MQCDGSIFDAATYASFVALHLSKYPALEYVEGESGIPEDFELNSDLASALTVPISPDGIPIAVTIPKVSS
jgi:hypothetical protein